MALFYNRSTNVTGTGVDDIIIVDVGDNPISTNINAGAGDDVVFSDHDRLFFDAGTISNNSIANATSIDDETNWSVVENPDVIGSRTVPYTSVLAQATANQFDYYAVTVGANQIIVVDMDDGFGAFGGPTVDGVIRLLDAAGQSVASGDDSVVTAGGEGSVSIPTAPGFSRDLYLVYSNTTGTAQTFYIEVGRYDGSATTPGTFTGGETYMLNVTVTGHAATNIAAPGDDTVRGESGQDIIRGLAGDDRLYGGDDNDTIHACDGNDRVYGDDDTDILFGGSKDDRMYGGTGIDFLNGDDGNDDLFGGGNSDILYGGSGNDAMYGGDGSDMMYGGTGNDFLFAEEGTDTFVFSRGDGQDTVYRSFSFNVDPGSDNTIRFTDVASTDAVFSVAGFAGEVLQLTIA